jgi:hypothetical protein
MGLKVEKVDMWVAALKDTPGSLSDKLTALKVGGVNLKFVMARRAPDKPGKGVVFLSPVKGRKQIAAAKKAGFRKTKSLHAVRVSGPDRKGVGAKLAAVLAEKGVNLRGLSATGNAGKFVLHLALDSTKDATKAVRVLKAVK